MHGNLPPLPRIQQKDQPVPGKDNILDPEVALTETNLCQNAKTHAFFSSVLVQSTGIGIGIATGVGTGVGIGIGHRAEVRSTSDGLSNY